MITAIRLKVEEHFNVFPIDLFYFLVCPFSGLLKTEYWIQRMHQDRILDQTWRLTFQANTRSGHAFRSPNTQNDAKKSSTSLNKSWRVLKIEICFSLLSPTSQLSSALKWNAGWSVCARKFVREKTSPRFQIFSFTYLEMGSFNTSPYSTPLSDVLNIIFNWRNILNIFMFINFYFFALF